MPFEIVRNDITQMRVDAIVNTANPRPVIGSGTDAAIHAKAGPMLLMARKCIGQIQTGEARITPGFRLPAKHVIHTVGPIWQDGRQGETWLLRQCYENSLALARQKRLKSIAFPLISTGNYGFPKQVSLKIAMDVIRKFLEENEMMVYLVVFSREAFRLSSRLQENVRSFIDEQYVQQQEEKEYSFSVRNDYEAVQTLFENPPEKVYEDSVFASRPEPSRDEKVYASEDSTMLSPGDQKVYASEDSMWEPPFESLPRASRPKPKPKAKPAEKPAKKPALTLAQILKQQDDGFSVTLLKLIDQTGKKDSEIYRKANVSRQHFSKIRNNSSYKPTKSTALAFAIALELDLDQTRDLIGRAGYALTRSSKADLIIMYFIENRNYDIYDINATLFEFDQSLLGA